MSGVGGRHHDGESTRRLAANRQGKKRCDVVDYGRRAPTGVSDVSVSTSSNLLANDSTSWQTMHYLRDPRVEVAVTVA